MPPSTLKYQSGFANEFATEAIVGGLPQGQNAPQKHALGLYTEQFSGTSFASPRHVNRRTWTYRIKPSVTHKPYEEYAARLIRSGPFTEVPAPPNQLRWDPVPYSIRADGFCRRHYHARRKCDVTMQTGVGIHLYAINQSMEDRFFL